jgi:hypothetical protein
VPVHEEGSGIETVWHLERLRCHFRASVRHTA